ncbi:MAG: transposase [Myxococcota bacterium]|nr:transposase [Myxococcota bacterium]
MINEHSSFQGLLVNFSSIFTEPSFRNFMALVSGWALGTGRRTISRVIQVAGFGEEQSRHHSIFYRFFSRARWTSDKLGRVVLSLVLKLIPDNLPIILTVDDTLCRKSGAHLWGGGMHHDALLSNYGRGKSFVKFFSFGHNWVIVCVCISMPWNKDRWMAVPVAFRLYRSKKRCPKAKYRKRTELAREMLSELEPQIPQARAVIIVGDTEYACREVVRNLPPRMDFIGPMAMDAALYETPPKKKSGRGRPCKKGKRLKSPKQLIKDRSFRWKPQEMLLYGRQVKVLVKTQTCLWYTVAGGRLVRMIVTRDPNGRIEDRAYFSTDAEMTSKEIAQYFSLRWTQEEMHRNVKQHLGLEDPQNGWWRRPRGKRKNKKIPGPKPHAVRGEKAVIRTAPFILTVYALVVLWYLGKGSWQEDVGRARRRAPWYRQKREPAFGDMLAALRRHLWTEQNISAPSTEQGSAKINDSLLDCLCVA